MQTHNQNKHTPGPWDYDGKSGIVAAGKSPGMPYICDVRFSQKVPGQGDIHANARLIAAAPDLLEACKLVANVPGLGTDDPMPGSDTVDELCRLWPIVRAAIAKATGESEGTA